ncbi:unnamed protein product [Ectocarpus sp. 6 AP-2014]
MSFNGRRSPGNVSRGSISIITLLFALPKLLLLPTLAGAFFAPIGVLSSSAARLPSSSASPQRGADRTGAGAGEPALVNVAKLESAAATTLWNVPNILTMARVMAIPVFATIFYASLPRRNIWCSAIFAGAAFTDWLDGYIARRQGIVTPFGSFLDPVADKLLVSTALILLSERLGPWMTVCSAIILCRELGISALREWMAQLGLRETVKVGNAGKWKTATQMMAITMLLLLEPGAAVTLVNPATYMPIAKGLLYVSTVLTVTSGSGYLKAAWPALMGKA